MKFNRVGVQRHPHDRKTATDVLTQKTGNRTTPIKW